MTTPSQSEALAVSTWLVRNKFTATQMAIMLTLLKQESATMTELSTLCGCTTANITGVIDSMEKQSLVARFHSKEDRRKVMVGLTPPAIAKLRSIFPMDIENLHESFSR